MNVRRFNTLRIDLDEVVGYKCYNDKRSNNRPWTIIIWIKRDCTLNDAQFSTSFEANGEGKTKYDEHVKYLDEYFKVDDQKLSL